MAQDEPVKSSKAQARLVIRNIGLLLSGELTRPILDADTVLAVDGRITAVGKRKDIDSEGATLVIEDLRADMRRRRRAERIQRLIVGRHRPIEVGRVQCPQIMVAQPIAEIVEQARTLG